MTNDFEFAQPPSPDLIAKTLRAVMRRGIPGSAGGTPLAAFRQGFVSDFPFRLARARWQRRGKRRRLG